MIVYSGWWAGPHVMRHARTRVWYEYRCVDYIIYFYTAAVDDSSNNNNNNFKAQECSTAVEAEKRGVSQTVDNWNN